MAEVRQTSPHAEGLEQVQHAPLWLRPLQRLGLFKAVGNHGSGEASPLPQSILEEPPIQTEMPYPGGNFYSRLMYKEIADENYRFPNSPMASFEVARMVLEELSEGRGSVELFRTIVPTKKQEDAINSFFTATHRQAHVDIVKPKDPTTIRPTDFVPSQELVNKLVFHRVRESAISELINAIVYTPKGREILHEIQSKRPPDSELIPESERQEYDQLIETFAKEGGEWKDFVLQTFSTAVQAIHNIPSEMSEMWQNGVKERSRSLEGYSPLLRKAQTFVYGEMEQAVLQIEPPAESPESNLKFNRKLYARLFRLGKIDLDDPQLYE